MLAVTTVHTLVGSWSGQGVIGGRVKLGEDFGGTLEGPGADFWGAIGLGALTRGGILAPGVHRSVLQDGSGVGAMA